MANQVLGKNIIVSLLDGVTYYPIFCGKTAELPLEQDEIEVTHVNSGSSREYVPGMSNSTLSVTGITVLDNTEGRISPLYLAQEAIRRSIRTYRMLFTDQDGDQVSVTFSAFVRNITMSRDVTQWGQSSATFRITGDWVFSTVIPSPEVPVCEVQNPIYTTLLESADSVQSALLIQGVGQTLTILAVSRSGTVHYETTGTPGSLEFTYDNTTGEIFFDPANPGNPGGEPVSIEYKIEI